MTAPSHTWPTRTTRVNPWLAWCVATVPVVLSTFETVMFSRMANRPMPLWRAFVAEAPQWYGWALLAPIIVALGARFALIRPLRVRHIAIHAAASVSASLFVAMASAA